MENLKYLVGVLALILTSTSYAGPIFSNTYDSSSNIYTILVDGTNEPSDLTNVYVDHIIGTALNGDTGINTTYFSIFDYINDDLLSFSFENVNGLTQISGDWEASGESLTSFTYDLGTGGTSPSAVPEPGILALFAAGLIAIGFAQKQKKES
jgi:hypothetical protein